MVGTYFLKNIGDEMISLFSDIINDNNNKKKKWIKVYNR